MVKIAASLAGRLVASLAERFAGSFMSMPDSFCWNQWESLAESMCECVRLLTDKELRDLNVDIAYEISCRGDVVEATSREQIDDTGNGVDPPPTSDKEWDQELNDDWYYDGDGYPIE